MIPNGVLQPIGAAVAAMTSRFGTDLPLSDPLLRQCHLVAFEFVRLREERFGPDSHQTGLGAFALASEGIAQFLEEIEAVKSRSEVLTEARLAEKTLREIRSLWQADHFFKDVMKSFFEGLVKINVESPNFGRKLFRGLRNYREQRDKAESEFLAPYGGYRDQLLAIIEPIGKTFSFSHWEIHDRIKRGLLSKLERRQLPDMEQICDIVGLKILLGRQKEVDVVAEMIRSAFHMHQKGSEIDPSIPHYFQIHSVEVHMPTGPADLSSIDERTTIHRNDRGYRARHVDIRRITRPDNQAYPTAELQLKTSLINRIGEKQHPLSYKGDSGIPEEIHRMLNDYGRAAFDIAVALEEGRTIVLPDFDVPKIEAIGDESLVTEILGRLVDLESELSTMIRERGQATAG